MNFQIFDLICELEKSVYFHNKKIDANVVFRFNLSKRSFWHRKFNSIIIKMFNKFFIILPNSFWMYFYWINMPNMRPKKTCLDKILVPLCFLDKIFTVIWYLTSTRSLDKSLMLVLLASNWINGSFFQLIQRCITLHVL